MEPANKKQGDGGRNVTPKSRPFGVVFNLRTLLLIVTVLGIAVGYHMNWVSQRRAFLLEQVSRLESSLPPDDKNARAQLISWWNSQQPSAWRDPWLLRLLREQPPVYGMFVLVATKDIIQIHDRYEVYSSQSDLQRARRLFPEEEVQPMYWKPGTPESDDSGFKEVATVPAPES